MPSYMIDVKSLLDSDLAAFGDPAANWYAVLTWCAALHQIPAGSLPDDDAKLAYLVRLGRDVRTWKKFKEKGALRGWVLHSDGRFYHPVVTEKVLDLLGKSRAGKAAVAAREAARSVQLADNAQHKANDRSSDAVKSIQQDDNKGREGKGIEGKEREEVADLDQKVEPQSNLPALVLEPSDVTTPARKRRAKPRSAVDPSWQLPAASRQFARDRNWVDRRIDLEFDKFKNFHAAKGNLMADWPAAWRTWVGNDYAPRGPGGGAPPRSRADSTAEGIMAGIETHEQFDP